MKLIVKNGEIVNKKGGFSGKGDILISNGMIEQIGERIDEGAIEEPVDIIDAQGMTVLPGLIDAHCHLRDPGYEYKEDIESGTAAAAMGGFTAVACMPNTNPVADCEPVVRYIIDKARENGCVKVFPIGAISKGLKGEELAEIGEMKFAGAVGVSDDGKPVVNAGLMKKALQYADSFDISVLSHCECLELADGGDMNEGAVSTELGLRGIPAIAESAQVARDVLISEYTGIPIHICHVSTIGSINIIRDAKRRGVSVTCETCPHYFTLTDEACRGYNTNAKVNPPLASAADVEAVKEALADGTIDIIATDHAPHHRDEKNVEFTIAANGLVGFETAFPLAYTNLVLPGVLSMEQLVEKMCVNPAKMLRLDHVGAILQGFAADLTIVDTRTEHVVESANFKSKSKNTPFEGFTVHGSVLYTIVDGRSVVRLGVLVE